MKKFPASVGWLWVKEGFFIFRKQPVELLSLFLAYLFVILSLGFIPVVGRIVSMLLVPAFSIGFMQACVNIEQNKRVFPSVLLTGFRSPVFRQLLILGVLYIFAAVLAVAASVVIDGGVLLKLMTGKAEYEKVAKDANLSSAILFSGAVYLPFAMALWYAAPLVAWQNMSVFKSLFYSFFAVWNAAKAFLIYGLSWIAVEIASLVAATIVSIPVAALLGKQSAAAIVVFALFIVLASVINCSFYRTYIHIFGSPTSSPEPD